MRKYLIIFFLTIIIVYICSRQTNYINNLCIILLYITGIIIFLKRRYKIENYKNKNSNIIAAITHDLKTPAVAQIRALELLLKGNFGEITEIQRSFLNDILGSCNTMLDMLINMLWLYKFDNKIVALNISSFCINDLINEIFNENKLILSSGKHHFEYNYKTMKVFITADRMHIKRIISNLLINAVNHSKEDTTISIETYIENDLFIFKIKNKGNFLSEDLLKCIFDKNKIFTQKSDGLSTGLGLYLSNSLLELNGGKILYKSEETGINTFGFTIHLNPKHKNTVYKTLANSLSKR